MSIIEAATPYLYVASLFGLAYIFRSTITLMLKILIAEFIDREEKLESRIYRAQTVERSKVHGQTPTSLTPPGVNGILEEIDQMRIDGGVFMSALQLEMEAFKNDVLLDCPCPEEFRLQCKSRFEKLEKTVKNGS